MKDLKLFKRSIAFFAALLLLYASLFSFVSCADGRENDITVSEENEEPQMPGGTLAVPYISDDSLNPFYSKTVFNYSVVSLVYRSLYYMDASFTPKNDLAASESFSGAAFKIKIIPDLVFSDSCVVSAQDVVYSFECAKKAFFFSETLKGIASCEAEDSLTVIFKLAYADVNALNALTFPIVKRGTAEEKTSLPTGCGCYRFLQDGIRLSLSANLKYAGKIPAIGALRLVDVTNLSSPEHLVDTGELDFCYSDLSDANINRVYSSVTSVYLNNLVFLGVNSESKVLALSDLRQAVSYAVDRQSIAENVYMGFARAACVPFNTSWRGVSSSEFAFSVPVLGDKAKAAELFSSMGIGEEKNSLKLRLVCSQANSFIRNTASLIASALKEYNIDVEISAKTPEKLKKTVANGEYDMYLAEIKLPPTMDLSEFFLTSGCASAGINLENSLSAAAYFDYRKGKTDIDGFLSVFCSELPFIPLCYRSGRLCYTRKITSELFSVEDRIYGGISDWTYSE